MISRLSGEFKKKVVFFFSSYRPWALKTCNQDILKTIIAKNFKLGQLIENNEIIT